MYKKILAAGMAAFLVFSCFGCENSSYPLDPMAKDGTYVMETVPAVLKETEYFRIQINSNPVEQADGRFPFFIGNPEENRKNLQVYICLASTGEEIYRSGVLEPGEREVYGKITKQLPSGDHEAAAAFVFLDPEDETAAGSVETKIVLTVE